ncbi:MAG TPA: 50S ribosomal protein L15 [Polyangiaceae bacterium]|nr:50S ribosomal protein L15 [Polyangiaceae bacterium]
MSDLLSRLVPPEGARQNERRIGRGQGCRKGKICGRGFKGQKARHGGNIEKMHFQGGQTPIQRRLPKRGFRVPFPEQVVSVNIGSLERFAAGSTVDLAALSKARLVQDKDAKIKVLGDGKLSKKLKVSAHFFSKSALEKIEKAGGQAIVLGQPAKADA